MGTSQVKQIRKKKVRLSSEYEDEWLLVLSFLAVWQMGPRAMAISIPHWNKSQSNVKKKMQTQVLPGFSQFSEKAGNLIFQILFMKSGVFFFNKCWQINSIKNKTPCRPTKYILQAGFHLRSPVHIVWPKRSFMCARDGRDILVLTVILWTGWSPYNRILCFPDTWNSHG